MPTRLHRIRVQNYRSLADVDLALRPINVMFGPNGAGKSTLLDALVFVLDGFMLELPHVVALRGPDQTLFRDDAPPGSVLSIGVESDRHSYERTLRLSGHHFDSSSGERLSEIAGRLRTFVERSPSSDETEFLDPSNDERRTIHLQRPDFSCLPLWIQLGFAQRDEFEFFLLLQSLVIVRSETLRMQDLKLHGSESSQHIVIGSHGEGLFSAFRNLHDRRDLDDRYDVVLGFMRRAFPELLRIVPEQSGPLRVYASFVLSNRKEPVLAIAAPDGYLHLLTMLIPLFAESPEKPRAVLFDEPETSLHPWAIAVFAEAVKLATSEWNRQVFIATHSPVLLSQFEPADCLAVETEEGRTQFRRLSEIPEIQDLLDVYSPGALYMSEAIAHQSSDPRPWFDDDASEEQSAEVAPNQGTPQ